MLGLDPGKKNFAWALVSESEILGHGLLPTITNLTEHRDQLHRFIAEVTRVLCLAPDTTVVMERMMHRPGLGGYGVVEYINIMNGVVLAVSAQHGIHCRLVSPATWKSHYQREFKIPRGRFTMTTQKMSIRQPPGSKTKTKTELVPGVLGEQEYTVHEGDAIGIACYGHHTRGVNVLGALRVSQST